MMPREQYGLEKPQGKSRRQDRGRQGMLRAEKARALETTAKLTVNLVLAAAAISGLTRLLPLYQSVQEKSLVIQTEVKRTEDRVNRWQRDFNRAFDPGQAKTVMQEESHRVAPQRRPIVLIQENNQTPNN